MKILIITPFYSPDIGPSAPLFTMLCERLVKIGHQVTIVAAVPHYSTGRVPNEYRSLDIRKTIENGVKVIRVPVPSLERTRLSNRILQFITYQIGATWSTLLTKYDVALITNPAIETWLPMTWHAVFRRKPVIFSVFDVYPDVGINLGIFKNTLIIKVVSLLERSCLKPARAIQIISDNFKQGLRQLGVPESKIKTIPVWVDADFFDPVSKSNAFSMQNNLDKKFVVLYAGNIGLSQGLESVLDSAKLLLNDKEIVFVFIGGGAGLKDLESIAQEQKLSNAVFLPFQPREQLPQVLCSADILLVVLRKGIGLDSLPSKTFPAMASGRPIVASIDEKSELHRLINEANSGICVPPEDPEKLAKAIRDLKQDPDKLRTCGGNGRRYIEQNHSVQIITQQFEELFSELLKEK